MKKLFILGLCGLFMACSNSAQKERETAGPDPNTDTMSTARPAASPAPATASTDTAASAPAPADKTNTPAPAAARAAPSEDNAALIKKGQALYSQLDCFACHHMTEKRVGPAYADVAKKYPNTAANVDYLIGKIRKGGSGVWGEVPMSPHPTLSDDDARALVQYVLSAK